jgi:hypothetical protein
MTPELGLSYYERIDAGATPEQLKFLKSLTPSYHVVKELAGEPVTAVLSTAPGNNAPIAGSRSSRDPAGSRRGLRAPRRSTRFTPKVFATLNICAGSSRRRRRKFPRLSKE